MGAVKIVEYEASFAEKWDEFVLDRSFNGTFLQTRRFLGYHPEDRFQDNSLIVYKGTSDILAVIPGCVIEEDGRRNFCSHAGSTFGGIVASSCFYNLDDMDELMACLDLYLESEGFDGARLKQSSQIFCSKRNDLIEYLYYQHGWREEKEISFVIDFSNYEPDILSNLTSSRRRGYRKGEKAGLSFRELSTDEEIASFYVVLCENLMKYDTRPVHTLDELMEFKRTRLTDTVQFFGAFMGNELAAASMVFRFSNRVFHTQYLASSQRYLNLFPNNFLDVKMIEAARKDGFRYFSFGISTEDHGHVLNRSLAQFKEGFGTTYCNNRTFVREFE